MKKRTNGGRKEGSESGRWERDYWNVSFLSRVERWSWMTANTWAGAKSEDVGLLSPNPTVELLQDGMRERASEREAEKERKKRWEKRKSDCVFWTINFFSFFSLFQLFQPNSTRSRKNIPLSQTTFMWYLFVCPALIPSWLVESSLAEGSCK